MGGLCTNGNQHGWQDHTVCSWDSQSQAHTSWPHELYLAFCSLSLPGSASFIICRLYSFSIHSAPPFPVFLIVLCWLMAFLALLRLASTILLGLCFLRIQRLFWALFLSASFWFWICCLPLCCFKWLSPLFISLLRAHCYSTAVYSL